MANDEASSIQTRPSFLNRLKSGEDTESWQDFYRIYGKLVRDFAIRAGLNDTEADEVVQETAIAIARHLPTFQYDPRKCRFKTWLLNQTSWRIKDQLRKRRKEAGGTTAPPVSTDDETDRTATVDRVPDPATADLEAMFESQWHQKLFAVALERVKPQFSLKQFQVFDLLVVKEWPAAEVADSLGVSLANVYVTKHRVAMAVKKEAARIERDLERSPVGLKPPDRIN